MTAILTDTRKMAATVTTVLALAVLGTTGFAQVHEIVGGRVLDSNPQVGSGGSNSPVPGYVPINGNAIIYGQVSGLGRFHGDVPSSSPYTFQGNLPSGQIADFAARSAPLTSGGAAQAYILPSNVVSTAGGAIHSSPINGGFESRLIPAMVAAPVTGTSGADSYQNSQYRVVNRAAPQESTDMGNSQTNPLQSPLWNQRNNTGPLIDTNAQDKTGEKDKGDLGKPKNVTTPNPLDKNPPDNNNNGDSTNTTGAGAANNVRGQVRGNIDSAMVNGSSTVRPGDTVRTGNSGTANTDTGPRDLGKTAMVTDTFKTLQGELEKQRLKAEADAKANGTDTGMKPPANNNGGTATANKNTNTPDWTAPGDTNKNTAHSLADEPASRLKAGQNVPPLVTLAGSGTPVDEQLKKAEGLLKDEKYLDAIDAYESVLVSQPANALGLVGRAHAELGAGMYQSAAYDLKSLYTKKPEMAAVHYKLADFLPEKRVDNLMEDLMKLTTEEKSGNTASFLYCYMAYNLGRDTDLKEELDRWGIRTNHDEWQAVAAKAWGK